MADSLLHCCFGPQGLKILDATRDDRQVYVTSGAELLQVDPFLRKGLDVKSGGDVVKKQLLVSTTALLEARKLCEEFSGDSLELPIKVSKCLRLFEVAVQSPTVESPLGPAMTTFCLTRACVATPLENSEALKTTCQKLLTTCFGNAWSYSVRKRLKELVIDCIFSTDEHLCLTRMSENLNDCKRDLLSHSLFHTPLSVSETKVLRGFLLDKKFTFEPSNYDGRRLKTVLLLSGLEVNPEGASFNPKSQDELHKILTFAVNFKRKVIDNLMKNNVRLLLCGGPVSTQWAYSLQESDISTIQMVPEETLIAMAEANKTHPFSSCLDLVSYIDEPFLSCYHYLNVGKKRYIHIQTSSNDNVSTNPRSFLFCASTTDHCQSLKILFNRAFKTIENWLQSVNERNELVSLCGRGAWEMELIKQIRNYVTSNNIIKGSAEWIAAESLTQGFLAIPQTLLRNSVPGTSVKNDFLITKKIYTSQQSLLGIDVVSGSVTELDTESSLTTWPVLEPFRSQQHLFSEVCSFMSKVLCIDHCINISRPLSELVLNKGK